MKVLCIFIVAAAFVFAVGRGDGLEPEASPSVAQPVFAQAKRSLNDTAVTSSDSSSSSIAARNVEHGMGYGAERIEHRLEHGYGLPAGGYGARVEGGYGAERIEHRLEHGYGGPLLERIEQRLEHGYGLPAGGYGARVEGGYGAGYNAPVREYGVGYAAPVREYGLGGYGERVEHLGYGNGYAREFGGGYVAPALENRLEYGAAPVREYGARLEVPARYEAPARYESLARYEAPRLEAPRYEALARYEAPRLEAPRYEAPARYEVPALYEAPARYEAPAYGGYAAAPVIGYGGERPVEKLGYGGYAAEPVRTGYGGVGSYGGLPLGGYREETGYGTAPSGYGMPAVTY